MLTTCLKNIWAIVFQLPEWRSKCNIFPAYKWGQVFILSNKYTASNKTLNRNGETKQTWNHAQYAFLCLTMHACIHDTVCLVHISLEINHPTNIFITLKYNVPLKSGPLVGYLTKGPPASCVNPAMYQLSFLCHVPARGHVYLDIWQFHDTYYKLLYVPNMISDVYWYVVADILW